MYAPVNQMSASAWLYNANQKMSDKSVNPINDPHTKYVK